MERAVIFQRFVNPAGFLVPTAGFQSSVLNGRVQIDLVLISHLYILHLCSYKCCAVYGFQLQWFTICREI